MSLSKTLTPLLSTVSNQESSKHDCKIVDWDVKNQLEQIKNNRILTMNVFQLAEYISLP